LPASWSFYERTGIAVHPQSIRSPSAANPRRRQPTPPYADIPPHSSSFLFRRRTIDLSPNFSKALIFLTNQSIWSTGAGLYFVGVVFFVGLYFVGVGLHELCQAVAVWAV
jgi:hypothetical protein